MINFQESVTGKIKIRIPELEDIDHIISELRASDKRDLETIRADQPIAEVIFNDVIQSKVVLCLYVNDAPCLVFGIIQLCDGVGVPWMVSSAEVENHSISLARISKRLLKIVQYEFPVLVTWISKDNQRSLSWHRWCGFHFSGTHKIRSGVFIKAVKKAESVQK
ncbi:hypothetical protein [Maridesulfovibrio bastinii]|uniref:hypothetical protein n=1 Tax=Maridesulfovibrio bastinii TaxID=47157 RepID=UPI000427F135|nr:hypothetical protein [Maridesulfovibrio bastinii]